MIMASSRSPASESTLPATARPKWSLRGKLLLALASVVLALLIAEVTVRVFNLGPKVYVPRRFEPNGGVPFTAIKTSNMTLPVYQPRVVFASKYDPAGDVNGEFGPDGRVVYRINSLGMRGDAVVLKKPPNTFRVVCLGDSITFGEGVYEEQTYPQLLQGILSRRFPTMKVEVINAGVQGYGIREETELFFARCRSMQPDVVTLGLFLNDAMEFPETIRLNDEISRDAKLSVLSRMSRLCELIERNHRTATLQDEYFSGIRRSFDSEKWKKDAQLITTLQTTSTEDYFKLVVVLFPILWNLDGAYPFDDLHERIRRDIKVPIVDLLDSYRGMSAESLWVHPTDHHPNAKAHRIAAERIAKAILKSSGK